MTWTPSPMRSATPRTAPLRIVLGVSGGIAAYKSVELLRLFRDAGYFVSPVLTPDATRFVGAVTFSALGSEPARTSLYGDTTTPIPHTYLGQNADLIVVAPATAHLIARYAAGLGDDLLVATLLASRSPVLLCPAMHTEMWEQPSVQENLATLRRRGVMVLEPEVGPLAGGDVGAGRMREPHEIFDVAKVLLEGSGGPLGGKKVLVSAGGTREPIDPVRFISNRSSGHQGYAIAEVASRMGADVTLVSAADRPLALDVARAIQVISVHTASQMHDAVLDNMADADVIIMAAAVSDFTVKPATEKLKREQGIPQLTLEATQDILADVVRKRSLGQVIVGFAAETANVMQNAEAKLHKKGVDLLVVNDVSADHVGFNYPTNEVTIFSKNSPAETISLRSKEAISYEILDRVAAVLSQGAS